LTHTDFSLLSLEAFLGISSTPPESTPVQSKKRKGKPALVSPDTRTKLDLISQFASQAQDEKIKEQEALRRQKSAAEIKVKRTVKAVRLSPSSCFHNLF
jgi:hypothetical protein